MTTIGEEMLQARVDQLESDKRTLLEKLIEAESVIEKFKTAMRSGNVIEKDQAVSAVMNLNALGAALWVTHIKGYLGTVRVVRNPKESTPS